MSRLVVPISVVLVVAAVLGAAHGAPAAVTADLAASVNGPGVAGPGTQVTFIFSVRNDGPARAENVIVRNTLTSGATTFVSIAAPGSWSCNVPAVGASADNLSCSAPGLDAGTGGLAQFTLVVRVSPSATGTITETVRASSSTSDRNFANDSSRVEVRVVPSADLSVSISGPASAPASTLVAYDIVVRNNGPSHAQSVRLISPIPAQTTYSRGTGSGWSCTFFSLRNPQDLDCNGSVGAGQTSTIRLELWIAPSATGTITSRARVVYDNDPGSANNDATLATPVSHPRADLGVAVRGPAAIAPGASHFYPIDMTNGGPDIAHFARVKVELTGSATLTGMTSSSGSAGCAIYGQNHWECGFGDLAPGATVTLFAAFTVDAAAAGSISVAATGSSASADPNAANDTGTKETLIAGEADISVSMIGPATAAPDTDITYVATVTNIGPGAAETVSVFFEDYPGTFVSIAGPAEWECADTSIGGTSPVGCNLARLEAGAEAEITLVVHVDPDQSDPFSNFVTASSLRDPNPANDDASVDTIIGDVGADLAVTKRGPSTAQPGSDLTYTIELTNLGPDPAANARVADPIPAKTTYVSVNGPAGWTCTGPNLAEGNSAVCVTPELASGESATFTVVVLAASSATGTITNTAFATTETPEPSYGNNTSTSVATIGTAPAGVPSAPSSLAATAGNGQVALTWLRPASDGGSPLTGYDVYLGTTSRGQSGTPVNAAPLPADATSFTATGLANGTRYFFTVKAINARGHSAASNEAAATPVAVTSIVYNGALVVSLGSSFAPRAVLSSGASQCLSGQTVSFALDANPFTGVTGTHPIGMAVSAADGQATAAPLATDGWKEGVYAVTASFTGAAGSGSAACTPSFDTAIVTVAASGSTAHGAGWYSLGGSGRIGFGFTIRAESNGGHSGRLQLVNNEKWRLKGALSVYAKRQTGEAAASGTGDLYWWNPVLNAGAGGWALARSGMPFTINFTASGSGKKASPGTFGITFDYNPQPPQPGALPISAPQPLRGGSIEAT